LIPRSECVRNSVILGGEPRLVVVSGSNMSGKSTLLRTVGINAVLAFAGAPVRAERLRISPLAIGATLRVQDSLQKGTSRFYAEIQRIRDVVERTSGPMPVLFLLDEVLHGTNSHDRARGASGILQALVRAGAIGLATTHDLALTAVADDLGGQAINVHFEDRIEGERMVFDYRMKPGVVEKSNALALMRALGLDV
jgi:DNA mismatch repair ATPase MutS